MNEATVPSYIAIICSVVTLLLVVGKDLFGGGTALATKFANLEKDTTLDITKLRTETTDAIHKLRVEVMTKVDEYEDAAGVGFKHMNDSIHDIQIKMLEFRAKMAEEYIPKGGLEDMKADMHRGFEAVERRMGELQDMIMWAQPQQLQPHSGPPKR